MLKIFCIPRATYQFTNLIKKLPSREQMLKKNQEKLQKEREQKCDEVVRTIKGGIFKAYEEGETQVSIKFPPCKQVCPCLEEIASQLTASSPNDPYRFSFVKGSVLLNRWKLNAEEGTVLVDGINQHDVSKIHCYEGLQTSTK